MSLNDLPSIFFCQVMSRQWIPRELYGFGLIYGVNSLKICNFYKPSTLRATCATPYEGMNRGLWEGHSLTAQGCPLAEPLGMPTRHIAHASLRQNTGIHYYLLMDFIN